MTWMLVLALVAVVAVPLAVRRKSGARKKDADAHNIYPVW
jgi:hypothetical protein